MTISVTNNADGSFTVTCGAESVRVAPSAGGAASGGASAGGGAWTPISAGGGGVTASLVKWPIITVGGGGVTAAVVGGPPDRRAIERVRIATQAEMDSWLRGLVRLHEHAERPGVARTALRIELAGEQPLEIAPVARAWTDTLSAHYSLCEIHLADLDG